MPVFALAGARAARFLALACCALCVCSPAVAQRGGIRDPIPEPEDLAADEAAERLDRLRRQRLAGDFVFHVHLEHLPRRGDATTYRGKMWGTWRGSVPWTRVTVALEPKAEGSDAAKASEVEVLLRAGPEPKAWRRADGAFRPIEGAALFEPLIPGVPYSAFDLQMPFLHWKDFDYLGPKEGGYPAQRYLLRAPGDAPARQAGVRAARLFLDDRYNALRRVDLLGSENEVRSSFRVRSFKKVQDQYIVKTVDLVDEATQDRARFEVRRAAVGLDLPDGVFDPNDPEQPPALPESRLESL